jgi:hypothetical protein
MVEPWDLRLMDVEPGIRRSIYRWCGILLLAFVAEFVIAILCAVVWGEGFDLESWQETGICAILLSGSWLFYGALLPLVLLVWKNPVCEPRGVVGILIRNWLVISGWLFARFSLGALIAVHVFCVIWFPVAILFYDRA